MKDIMLDDNLFIRVSEDGYSFPVNHFYNNDEARALADAIYAELGLGWLPYPENKPKKNGWYWLTIENENGLCLKYAKWTGRVGFTDEVGWEVQDIIHAYRPHFDVYQPA